jgi:hypothetical protein
MTLVGLTFKREDVDETTDFGFVSMRWMLPTGRTYVARSTHLITFDLAQALAFAFEAPLTTE